MEAFLGQFSGYLPHTTQGYISLVAAVLGIISLLWLFPFRFVFTAIIMSVGVWAGITYVILFAIPPIPTAWAMVVSSVVTSIIYGKYIPHGYVTIDPQKAAVYRNKYSLGRNGYVVLRAGVRTTMFIYQHFKDIGIGLQEAVKIGSGPEDKFTSGDGSTWKAVITVAWKVGPKDSDIITFAKTDNSETVIALIKSISERELQKLIGMLKAEPDTSGRMQISVQMKVWVHSTLLFSMTRGDGANELRRFGVVVDTVQLSDIDPPNIVEEEREEAIGNAAGINAVLKVFRDNDVEITEGLARSIILAEGQSDGHHGGGNIIVDKVSGDEQHQHRKGKGRKRKNGQGGNNTP